MLSFDKPLLARMVFCEQPPLLCRCDGRTPVWTNWALVQADAHQVGLTEVNPVVWGYQWERSTKPKTTNSLAADWAGKWLKPYKHSRNLMTNQPVYAIHISSHQGPSSSPCTAVDLEVISPRSAVPLKVTLWGWEIPYLTPDIGGLVSGTFLCM